MNLFTKELMKPYFDALEKCRGIRQKEVHHPEGDVFNHSLQVLFYAFKESYDTDLILAAMLHDIGKAKNSLGHEQIAIEMLADTISAKTRWLIEQHMRIWYLILGDMKKLSKVRELMNHPFLSDLILLARWDKIGRNPNRKIVYDKDKIIQKLNKCIEMHFDVVPK